MELLCYHPRRSRDPSRYRLGSERRFDDYSHCLHYKAKTSSPVRQGLVSMTGVFWDTVVMCALTGITIVSSMLKMPQSRKNFCRYITTFRCSERKGNDVTGITKNHIDKIIQDEYQGR